MASKTLLKRQKKCEKRGKRPSNPKFKTNHLWLNYGRKILTYALPFAKGDDYWRIRGLVGKLNSKEKFKMVFSINSEDKEEEKAFKIMLANTALNFIETKAEEAFEGSNYKNDMILEKERVSLVIKSSMGM